VFRDHLMLRLLFIVPLMMIFVLGNAVTTDVKNVPVAVHDQDRSPMSRELIRKIAHSANLILTDVEDDYSKLPSLLDAGKIKLALVIPRNFQRDVIRGEKPSLQLLVDGVDGNSAGVAMGYLSQIVQDYQLEIISANPAIARQWQSVKRVVAEPRFWFNPDLESRRYIIPGLVAIILLIITVFLTSMGIVREREIGTLEQLIVTPIRSYQLILGKVIPFSILGFVEITITMGFVYLIFGIGVQGSILLLFAESALFILTTLGLGILISTIAETQQQALFIGWFFMIFMMLLSGFFIPVANMPEAIQIVTYANPMRYFLVVLREIYLKGTWIDNLWPETLSMIGFGVVVLSAAVLRFRSRLE
jgi:ABC-2 type transport system permease protein